MIVKGTGGLTGGGDFGLVELRLARCWLRCPLIMGTDGGGKRRTWAEVSAGQVAKCPASMARHHVDNAGEKRAAWKNATRFAMVALEVGRSALACRKDGLTLDAMGGGDG